MLTDKTIKTATQDELLAEIVRSSRVMAESAAKLKAKPADPVAPQWALLVELEHKYLGKLVKRYNFWGA